jgi:hypothetical protein
VVKKVSVTQQPLSSAGGFWQQNVIGKKENTIDDVMQRLDAIERKLDLLLGVDPPEVTAEEEAEGSWVINKG